MRNDRVDDCDAPCRIRFFRPHDSGKTHTSSLITKVEFSNEGPGIHGTRYYEIGTIGMLRIHYFMLHCKTWRTTNSIVVTSVASCWTAGRWNEGDLKNVAVTQLVACALEAALCGFSRIATSWGFRVFAVRYIQLTKFRLPFREMTPKGHK